MPDLVSTELAISFIQGSIIAVDLLASAVPDLLKEKTIARGHDAFEALLLGLSGYARKRRGCIGNCLRSRRAGFGRCTFGCCIQPKVAI